jgi:hypothetical protein
MTSIGILQFPYKGKVIRDAMGRQCDGWSVVEDGRPGIPFESKEGAIRHAKGIIAIRCDRRTAFTVIDSNDCREVVTL